MLITTVYLPLCAHTCNNYFCRWVVQKLDLEVNDKQWTFYINPDTRDKYKQTGSQSEQDDKPETSEQNNKSELMYLGK